MTADPWTPAAIAAAVAAVEPGLRVVHTWPLTGGIAAAMTAVEVERPDGTIARFVLRSARRDEHEAHWFPVAREYALLVALDLLTGADVPAPHPRRLDESCTLRDRPFAVLDFIDGELRFSTTDPHGTARSYAAQLAVIHRIDGERPEFAALPRRTPYIAHHLAHPPEAFDESVREGAVRVALRARWPPPEPERLSLLHGDFWPGNILWNGDRIAGVLDWEDACVGDPLADVGVTRLDLLWAFGADVMAAFTDEYTARTGADVTQLPVWDLVAALRPAGALSLWGADWQRFGRPDVTPSTMRAAHRGFVDRALAALDGG
jgi:aminoglycoside phosphotransferase (APT) family kinase protein